MGYEYDYFDDEDYIGESLNLEYDGTNVPDVFKNKFVYFGACQKTVDEKLVRIVCDLNKKWGCLEEGKGYLFPCQYDTCQEAEDALAHYEHEADKLSHSNIL